MKKIAFILSFFLIILLIIFFKINSSNFDIKINIISKNKPAIDMNNSIAINVEDKLLKLDEIKDVYIFSKNENCNIYITLKAFYKFFKRTKATDKIKTEILNCYFEIDDISIDFEDDYNKSYNYFIVSYSDDFIYLDNITEGIFQDILAKKEASKILKLYDTYKICYINYLYSSLAKYNLNLEDIQNLIKENNFYSSTSKKDYILNQSTFIKNINDIENINIFYKNNNFSNSFKNVFDIKEDYNQSPDYLIFFNNQNASIVALNKKPFKKVSYKNSFLIKTSNYEKIVVILDKNSKLDFKLAKDINKAFEKEKIKNTLFFIGIDPPKTKMGQDFFENDKNILTIFVNKKYKNKALKILKNSDYILKNNNFEEISNKNLNFLEENLQNIGYDFINPTTYKQTSILYNLNNSTLNNYFLDKKTVSNIILSANNGFEAGYYYLNHRKIPIVIINNEDRIFIYSKYYKTLLPLDGLFKQDIKYDYYSILRKNGYYTARIYRR